MAWHLAQQGLRFVVLEAALHAIKLAITMVDQVRRRTQQATLGHRGRTHDPLSRIRKLLLTAAEQLTGHGRARLRAALPSATPSGRSRPPGRARNCCVRSWPPLTWLPPAPPWTASTAGAMVCSSSSCPTWPAPHVRLADRDPGLAPDHRLLQRAYRGDQPAHQKGEAGRGRLP